MAISRRDFLAGSATMGLGATLIACGGGNEQPSTPLPSTASAPAHPGGVLRWAQPAAFDHLDPHTTGFGGGFGASLIYDSLLRLRSSADPGSTDVEPNLAASYEQPDPQQMLLHLASGASFHPAPPVDGRPVDAEDVVFSLRRVTSGQPEFVYRPLFDVIDDIDVPEAGTVRLRLERPFAPLLRNLATPWSAVVPHELLELQGTLEEAAAGSGPYVLERSDPSTRRLTRSTSWWRSAQGAGLPNTDAIELTAIPRANDRFEALLAGATDWAAFVPFERADELDVLDGFARADYTLQDFQYVRLRTTRAPLRDVRVRRALTLAINREALIANAFAGRGEAHAVLPASVKPWAHPAGDLAYYQYDPEQAIQLLRAAGVEDGVRLTNLAPENVPLQNAASRQLISQWQAIGVDVIEQTYPYREYLERTFAGNFEVNVHWGNRYDDVDGYLSEFESGGARNFGAWGNDEVDALLEAQRAESDPALRQPLVSDVQHALAENAWAIGTASWLNTDAWTALLQDTFVNGDPFAQTRWLGESWITG